MAKAAGENRKHCKLRLLAEGEEVEEDEVRLRVNGKMGPANTQRWTAYWKSVPNAFGPKVEVQRAEVVVQHREDTEVLMMMAAETNTKETWQQIIATPGGMCRKWVQVILPQVPL